MLQNNCVYTILCFI